MNKVLVFGAVFLIFAGIATQLFNMKRNQNQFIMNDLEVVIKKPTQEEETKAKTWKIWNKEKTEFNMEYKQKEYCLIIKGKVDIITKSHKYSFEGGDYVIFPKGLKCKWIIKEDVSKYYLFE